MAEAMLEVRGLTKRFGGLTAVDLVVLQVYPGEVVGLIGDNGAGKSTLIKMVSGVYHPDEGQIFFQGKEIKLATPANA
ncbi:MAG: ATP-binding cassette domain-containing protein, partial [Spirochaetes bacterium]|nr:ATP-binding cassette domain-containing protein [Spirochaetota bacterium]